MYKTIKYVGCAVLMLLAVTTSREVAAMETVKTEEKIIVNLTIGSIFAFLASMPEIFGVSMVLDALETDPERVMVSRVAEGIAGSVSAALSLYFIPKAINRFLLVLRGDGRD